MPMQLTGNGSVIGLSVGGLPDKTVTQADLVDNIAGNGPAFSAQQNAPQSFASGVWTRVTMDVELFDSNNCYDPALARFTPNVAGLYQLNWSVVFTAGSPFASGVYKNGGIHRIGTYVATTQGASGSACVVMNGSTDYVDVWAYQGSAGSLNTLASLYCVFSGFLARAA